MASCFFSNICDVAHRSLDVNSFSLDVNGLAESDSADSVMQGGVIGVTLCGDKENLDYIRFVLHSVMCISDIL